MVQQFQNLKSNQEENKDDHDPPAIESEKKINKRMNKMEEMIRKARKMEDLMDYDSLSLFPDVRLPPKFKMPTLDKFDGTSCPKSHLKIYIYEGYAALRRDQGSTCSDVPKHTDRSRS